MATHPRITKRTVDQLSEGQIAWDTDVKGFGVRRQRSRRVYILKARINGRQRWLSIGEHGAPWTPETARKEAQRLWGEIRSGTDIAALRLARKERVRVSDLCDRYLIEHADEHKKPSSVRMDRRNIFNHVKPILGDLFVADVSRAEVEQFKLAVKNGKSAQIVPREPPGYRGGAVVRGGPGVANRCLALLSKMFNLAEGWGLRPENSNPVRHIGKYAERRMERYLTAAEFERLAVVLAKAQAEGVEDPYIVAAIRLLILTGARLGGDTLSAMELCKP